MKKLLFLLLIALLTGCGSLKYNAGYLRYGEDRPAPIPYHLQVKQTIKNCTHEFIDKDVQASTAFSICDSTFRPARGN